MKRRLNSQEWGLDLWNRRWGFVQLYNKGRKNKEEPNDLAAISNPNTFSFFYCDPFDEIVDKFESGLITVACIIFRQILFTPHVCVSLTIFCHIVGKCHCLCSSTKMSPSPASEVVAIVLHFDYLELMEVLLQLRKLYLADQPIAPVQINKCLLLLFWKPSLGSEYSD